MRFNFLVIIPVLGITVTASSSPAASTTSSAAASSAAASGSGKAVIVTDKTVTFTMPAIADPSGKVPIGTMPKVVSSGSGTNKGTQIFNNNGGNPTPSSQTNSPSKTNAAAQLNHFGAAGGVGALLLPFLL